MDTNENKESVEYISEFLWKIGGFIYGEAEKTCSHVETEDVPIPWK